MVYGNGRATIIELAMVYIADFGDFCCKGSREFVKRNILLLFSPPREDAWPQRNAAWLPRTAARPSRKATWLHENVPRPSLALI